MRFNALERICVSVFANNLNNKINKHTMTKLEILNKYIDFSKDGVIERHSALQAMQEYADQQLRLHVVGCSLPSEEEVTSEIVDYIGINKLTKGIMLTETQCLAFEIGFRKCYGWLMKR